uniref:BTB domain-containing protein n=1 Tax=Panagrellus redivivus TaxID=6233 RepID=A0A7E4UNU3_PANRE
MSHEVVVHAPSMWHLIAGNDQVKPDVTFIVENKELSGHRHYLSLISPVFKAMFETDTSEAKTGRVVINDFTFDETKTAVKFIYGKSFKPGFSIERAFAVYKFLDKYGIDNASKRLIPFFEQSINNNNFVTVSNFAWTFAKEDILNKCVSFLASHRDIAFTKAFVELDQRLVMELLQKASALVPQTQKLARSRSMSPIYYE